MQHFNITIQGAGEIDGVHRDVEASTARAALARVVGKPYQAGMKIEVGMTVTIEIRRWK